MFNRRMNFRPVDPLGNGLAEEIAAMRRNPDSRISLTDHSADELVNFWTTVLDEARRDDSWFTFTNE